MTANPFVNQNTLINKDKFIGREDEIENPDFINIKNSIFSGDFPKNLAIVGIPRVGKSSLVHNAIVNRENDLYDQKKVLTIPIDFSIYRDSTEFFCSLVNWCEEKMESKGCYNLEVEGAAKKVHEDAKENGQYNIDSIKVFFAKVGEMNHHSLFILDKFDHAPKIFKNEQDFYRFRDLASELKISFVLIARRCINVIEQEARSSSPFHQLFEPPVRLAMFSNDDLNNYFSKFKIAHITISENDRRKILYYCGSHPNLLQLLGYHIVNSHAPKTKKPLGVDEIFQNILKGYVDRYYNQLCEFLEDIKLLVPLHQIFHGNTINLDHKDELEHYGLIQEDEESGDYIAFSEHFQKYLDENKEKFRDNYKSSEQNRTSEDSENSVVTAEYLDTGDDFRNRPLTQSEFEQLKLIWSRTEIALRDIDFRNRPLTQSEFEQLKLIWSRTEIALRDIITTAMCQNFGGTWIEDAQEQYTIFETIIKKCLEKQQGIINESSGNRESSESDLFGFTMTPELFQIVLNNDLWNNSFKDIFGKTYAHWKIRKDFILGIGRKLVEHNNRKNILLDQGTTFMGYCLEILRIHEEFTSSVNTVQSMPDTVNENQNKFSQDADEHGESSDAVVSPQGQVPGASTSIPTTGTPTSAPIGIQEGTVNWINNRRRFGRIIPSTCATDKAEGIFVHVSNFPVPGDISSLKVDQQVKFIVKSTNKGWEAEQVEKI